MKWYAVMSIASTFAFLLPVGIILYRRLYTCPSLLILLIYFLLGCFDNVFTNYLPVAKSFSKAFGIVDNFLDIPMMLAILLFFSASKWKTQTIQITLLLFVVFEAVVILLNGFNRNSVIYIVGPGIILIIGYSLTFFVQFIKYAIRSNKMMDKTLMISGIFFYYGSNAFIYFFNYTQKANSINDIFLLYYVSCIILSILISIGLIIAAKRLHNLKALKITRKELQMIYPCP